MLRDPLRDNEYRDQTHFKAPPRAPTRKRSSLAEDPERKRARMMLRGTKAIRNILKDRYDLFLRPKKKVRMLPPPPEGDQAAPAEEKKPPAELQALPAPPPQMALPAPEAVERESDQYEPSTPRSDDSFPETDLAVQPSQTAIKDREDTPVLRKHRSRPRPEPYAIGATPGLRMPQDPVNVPVPEDRDLEQEWEAQMRQQLPDERTRRSLMDDVPLQIKRKVEFPTEEEAERQVKRLRSNFCATVAASTVFGELQNEWISRYEVDVLRRLTGLPVTAARIHRTPRKRFQRPQKMLSRARLSILLGREPTSAFIVNETSEEVESNPRRRAGFEWRGMTIFYQTKSVAPQEKKEVYIQLPTGLHVCQLTSDEETEFKQLWLEELHDCLLSEVMILKLKKSGKELDPAYFDKAEKEEFHKADVKEWSEWINNKVVRLVSPEEEAKVPPQLYLQSAAAHLEGQQEGRSATSFDSEVSHHCARSLGPPIGRLSHGLAYMPTRGSPIGQVHCRIPRLGRSDV